MLKVVIASGKGGTGKTLTAVSLALAAAARGSCVLLDADVEAPNSAIFLKPTLVNREDVVRKIPHVDESRCTHHKRCAKVCQYNAIAALPTKTIIFPEICHSCGSCALQCPEKAILETDEPMGVVESGYAREHLAFAHGLLTIGQAMSPPVIRALKKHVLDQGWGDYDYLVIDSPPGTACPVVETLKGADVALLVTEPTPFGLHDLALAVDVARDMFGLPIGIVLNKAGSDDRITEEYCRQKGLPILLRIPLDRRIGEAYSTGIPLVEAQPDYRVRFGDLLRAAEHLAAGGVS